MKNKTMLIVGAIIIILLVVLLLNGRSSNTTNPEASPSESMMASESPTQSTGPATSPKTSVSSTVPPSILSYQDALKKYGDVRIQFNITCQASPSQLTIKNGGSIMLDNRSGDARTFAVGSTYFTLPGYGFRIFTPVATSFPATFDIDCGSAQNVGKVTVQR